MAICLTAQQIEKFKQGFIDGSIDPTKLNKMTSPERRSFFTKILDNEDLAIGVNSLFESKLLLKNQKLGMISWAKKIVGMSPEAKRDILSKIQRMDRVLDVKTEDAFLNDLASKRLGIDITFEEAKAVAELSDNVKSAKELISENSPKGSAERLRYGKALVLFKEFVSDLKVSNTKMSVRDYLKNPAGTLKNAFYEISGATKSFLSTLDNSFFGRQGIKTLFTNPDIWANSFVKSWRDISSELAGRDAMTPIKADVYSRPNAVNGKYQRAKIDIGLETEEAFPSPLPEKIPVLGRVFKGAESAFNGAALRMRADLADRLIEKMEKQGIDTLDKAQMEGVGNLINSMTGRGDIGKLSTIGKEINATFFSIRFLKSNFDTLTMHLLDSKATPFVRKQAAINMLKIVGNVATILTIAEALHPNSVETDLRSTNFGKIKIGNRTFDVTGGMSALLSAAMRLTPTRHNGQWGFWTKNSATGEYRELTDGAYGRQTALDIFEGFFEGRLSPFPAGLIRDVWIGKDYSGDKVTFINELKNLTLPLPIQQFEQLMRDPIKSGILISMILEGLGISMNVQIPKETKATKAAKKRTYPKQFK